MSRLVDELCRVDREAPVDRGQGLGQFSGVSKKPTKVEETAGTYVVKKTVSPAQPAAQQGTDLETVRKNNARLMQVHAKVLQKLAQ